MTVPSPCFSQNIHRLTACVPPRNTSLCQRDVPEPCDAHITLCTTQQARCASRNTHLSCPHETHRAAPLNLITLSPRRHCAETHIARGPMAHTSSRSSARYALLRALQNTRHPAPQRLRNQSTSRDAHIITAVHLHEHVTFRTPPKHIELGLLKLLTLIPDRSIALYLPETP